MKTIITLAVAAAALVSCQQQQQQQVEPVQTMPVVIETVK